MVNGQSQINTGWLWTRVMAQEHWQYIARQDGTRAGGVGNAPTDFAHFRYPHPPAYPTVSLLPPLPPAHSTADSLDHPIVVQYCPTAHPTVSNNCQPNRVMVRSMHVPMVGTRSSQHYPPYRCHPTASLPIQRTFTATHGNLVLAQVDVGARIQADQSPPRQRTALIIHPEVPFHLQSALCRLRRNTIGSQHSFGFICRGHSQQPRRRRS